MAVTPATPFDELLLAYGADAAGATPRAHLEGFWAWLASQPSESLERARQDADLLFRRVGITFNVYGDEAGAERLIPFDLIPRVLSGSEWARLERGLQQRVQALNAFLEDVYCEGGRIIQEGIVPAELIYQNPQYRPEIAGIRLPHKVWAHISGVDIVRAGQGEFYVLEDNLRVPSGVSYMIEDRRVMMRLFPELFAQHAVAPVEHYPDLLLEHLRSVAPPGVDDPTVVILTPGVFNSAYFEHAYLAQQMGVELVEGSDLFVSEGRVFAKTTRGPQRIDVIYRRIDDDFLDPLVFRADSVLGVPGLVSVFRAGRVSICNAIGTGIADDKAVYPFVPDMIRFYLDEDPVLSNVPTFLCRRPDECEHVLANLKDLVVKETHGAGGYGMLIGPAASQAEIEAFRQRIIASPQTYIAQPTLALSTCPTMVAEGIAPRHVDLRPFVLSGRTTSMVPGGLTRVALKKGSLVVNSSQGGGTKDTWVLDGAQ
ncbi:MAG: circularly permuted type 2 ATP-grasp protein [Burkholderiaceae bacterium]